ncbi:hypothetical protein VTH06DRAFT_4361 [Thermothelomyces fergusii]
MNLPTVARLSRAWFPSGGIAASASEDAHSKLVRAGFLRQSNAGMFHMLPLGCRVQDKIENLISGHMEESLAASRVSMSSISAESLWEKSGRLDKVASELFSQFFSDMKLPVLAAKASSGDMGGDLSHEYHLPTPLGEDRVVSCDSCDYVVNEEIADAAVSGEAAPESSFGTWRGITRDRTKLVNVWYPRWVRQPGGGELREVTSRDISMSAVKSVVPDLDTAVEDALPFWSAAVAPRTRTATEIINIIDSRLPSSLIDGLNVFIWEPQS